MVILKMDTIITLIQTLGVPITVMLWFMLRTDKILKELTKIVADNTTATKILTKLIENKQ